MGCFAISKLLSLTCSAFCGVLTATLDEIWMKFFETKLYFPQITHILRDNIIIKLNIADDSEQLLLQCNMDNNTKYVKVMLMS